MIIKEILNRIEKIENEYNYKIGNCNEENYNQNLDYILSDLLDVKFFIEDYIDNMEDL